MIFYRYPHIFPDKIPNSLSVLSLPWDTPSGRAFGVDLFVNTEEAFKRHILVRHA